MKPSRRTDPYWMLLPTLLFLFVFFLYPLGMLVKQSFFSWDLLTDARYVGLGNYRALMRSGELWHTFTPAELRIILAGYVREVRLGKAKRRTRGHIPLEERVTIQWR